MYQDLALVPQLTVYENLFLNREMTGLGRVGSALPPAHARAGQAVPGQHQRSTSPTWTRGGAALRWPAPGDRRGPGHPAQDAKILLLDEPLAAMGAKESALIMDLVKDLSGRGVSMIVIDHNYAHLFALCDRLNVIQQGKVTLDRASPRPPSRSSPSSWSVRSAGSWKPVTREMAQ